MSVEYRFIRVETLNGSLTDFVRSDVATSGVSPTFSGMTVSGDLNVGNISGDGSQLTGIDNTYVTGGTYSNRNIVFTDNSGTTFTVLGVDNYVSGASMNGNTLELSRTGGLSDVTVDLSQFVGGSDNYVSGGTYNSGFIYFSGTNSSTTFSIDVSDLLSEGDTKITAFTYNNTNTFTISQDNGQPSYSATINEVTALTVTNYIDYTTGTKPTTVSGRTYFDRSENALSYFPETPSNDVTINVGQESVIRVYNGTGQQINNGQPCHVTSEQPSVNGVPSVILATATGSTSTGSHYEVSGVATHNIPDGTVGFITSFGVVRDLNITGVQEGSEIYLSDVTPGGLLFSPPTNTSARRSIIGHVVTTGVTDAKILVEISNEIGLFDLSNSQIAVISQNNLSTGTRDGGQMTINGGDNTLIDISSGNGVIADNFTDPNNPVITEVSWSNIVGAPITNLTVETGTFVFLDANANVVQFPLSTPPTEADKRDNIYLGFVGHASKVIINNIFNTPIHLVNPINQHEDLTSAIGPFSIGGNRVTGIPGTLQLQKNAGRSYFYGGNFHVDDKTPSQINTAALSGSTLIYATGERVLGPSGNTIDVDRYDPNGLGVITEIPANGNYVAHRIWHSPINNILIFQYGQEFYTNEATARDEFEFESYVIPDGLDVAAYLVAVIITQDGSTDLDDATIIPQGKFAGTGGGGGGAVDTLQSSYDNSINPEIITDGTRNSVDLRVGVGVGQSDSDQLITFQQNSGAINAFVTGLGDAKFNNLTGNSLTSLSTIEVYNGHVNLEDNSYFLQGTNITDGIVSLIGVDNQDRVYIGNQGYLNYIADDTIVNGILSAQTVYLSTTPTLNSSGTEILVRNSNTGEVGYRPVSGITPDTNFYVTGFTINNNQLELTQNDGTSGFTVDLSPYLDNTDTFVTGGTYDNGTGDITFTNNTGGTFTVDLSTLDLNDTFVTGVSFNNSTYILTTSLNSGTQINTNLSVLSSDVYVLGGVYDVGTGIVTYTNSTGGTFEVSGFTTGMTDSYTTESSLVGETLQFDNNIYGTNFYNVSLSPVLSGKTDLTLFNSHTADTTIHYTKSSINLSDLGNTAHTHTISEVINLQNELDSKTDLSLFNSHTGDTNNPHQTSFNNLTSTAHTHTISDVINLQSSLDSKTDLSLFNSHTGDTNNPHQTALSGLTDVNINSPQTDQVLSWNGTEWVNQTNAVEDNYVTGGTYNSGNINFGGTNVDTTFVVDVSSLLDDTNTYVTGGTYLNRGLTFTNNTGGTFTVLGVDNYVSGASINVNTLELSRTGGLPSVSVDLSQFLDNTDRYVTGGTYNSLTDSIEFSGNSGFPSFSVDLSSLSADLSGDTYVDSGSVVYTPSGSGTLTLVKNDTSIVTINGFNDYYVTGGTYNNGTGDITLTLNNGSTVPINLSSLDLNDTFVTGVTTDAGKIIISGNNGFGGPITGGTLVETVVGSGAITSTTTNGDAVISIIDGTVTNNMLVNDNITVTAGDGLGGGGVVSLGGTIELSAKTDGTTIQTNTDQLEVLKVPNALTINTGNGLTASTLTFDGSGTVSFGLDPTVIDFNDTYMTSASVTTVATNNSNDVVVNFTGVESYPSHNLTGLTDTFVTGGTYDNGTGDVTFTNNDGGTFTVDLSTLNLNDTFVTGSSFDGQSITISRNQGEPDITYAITAFTNDLQVGGTLNVDGTTTLNQTTVDGTLTNNGNIVVTGTSDFQGIISNTNGDITFGDNLVLESGNTLTACTGVYTNYIESCDPNGSISFGSPITASTLTALTLNVDSIIIQGGEIGDSTFKSDGEMYMVNNTVITQVPASSTPVRVSGATIAGDFNDFFHDSTLNSLTYTGATPQKFHITITTTAEQGGGGNSLVLFLVRKNGITQENLQIQQQYSSTRQALAINGILSLVNGDTLDLWLQNDTAAKDILVVYMNFTVVQI